MNNLIHLFKELYAYCTDFIINLANITELSYYELNFIIFILLYPLLLFVFLIVYLYQKLRLRSYRKKLFLKQNHNQNIHTKTII
jgi:hypothetical protein